MATEDILRSRSYVAGQDFSSGGAAGQVGQFCFVALDTSNPAKVVAPALGAPVLGIIQNKPASGQAAAVCRPGDKSKLILNGTVNSGGYISTDQFGNGIPTATGDYYVAIADESGVAGNVIQVTLQGKGAHL